MVERVLGPYRLGRLLASGGMAEIFEAEPLDGAGDPLVVKLLHPDHRHRPDFERLFRREIELVQRLRHPGIVTVIDVGVEDDPYIAMEKIDGVDLKTVLQQGPLPVELAAFIGHQVAEALHHAHDLADEEGWPLGLVHRDVCPHNILISWEGDVRLTDFGIARVADRAAGARAGQLSGKVGYLSPEQVLGLEVDRRSDVFSLGVVLYEALSGDRLFQAASRIQTLQAIGEAVVPPLERDDLEDRLQAILRQAMAKEGAERYATAADLARELRPHFNAGAEERLGSYLQPLQEATVVDNPAIEATATATAVAQPTVAEDSTAPSTVDATGADATAETAETAETAKTAKTSQTSDPAADQPLASIPVAKVHVIPKIDEDDHPEDVYLSLGVSAFRMRGSLGIMALVGVLVGAGLALHFARKGNPEADAIYAAARDRAERDRQVRDAVTRGPERTATLSVTSEPPGAEVFVNWMSAASPTPVDIPVRNGGLVLLRAELRDFVPYEEFVPVGEGATVVSRSIKLEATTEKAGVQAKIRSEPTAARVRFQGAIVGQTPLTIEGLRPNQMEVVRLEARGRTPQVLAFSAVPGKVRTLTVDLPPTDVDGNRRDLNILSLPPGASLSIDGEKTGTTPLFQRLRRGETLSVALEARGYEAWRSITTVDDASLTIWPALTKAKEKIGYVSVHATPAAKVYIGNNEVGRTPLKRHRLPAGRHVIVLETPQHRGHLTVTVQPEEIAVRKVSWNQEGKLVIQ